MRPIEQPSSVKRRAFVMLGAGVQSTVVAALAAIRDVRLAAAMGNLPEAAVFADTGWERAETYAFLRRFQAWCAERAFPVHVISSGNLRADGIAALVNGTRWDQLPAWVTGENGEAAPLTRACTKHYKVAPLNRFIREQVGAIPRKTAVAEKWFGISLDEIHRVKDSPVAWAVHRYPLIELRWYRQKCYDELERLGLGIPPKSACIGCPYRSDDSWLELKRSSPREFEDAAAFDDAIRTGFYGMTAGATFLHRSLRPLRALTFNKDQGRLFGDCFGSECEGLCGT